MNKQICKKFGDSHVCYFLVDKAQKRIGEIKEDREETKEETKSHFDRHYENINLPKDNKKDNKKDIQNLIHPIFGDPTTKPTTKDVPKQVRQKAQMTKASEIYFKTGDPEQVDKYLRNIDLVVDYELSTPEALVLVSEDGIAKIAFRGTELTNINDLKTDAKVIGKTVKDILTLGTDGNVLINIQSDPEIKKAIDIYENVSQEYVINEFVGFSLGGFKAMVLGERIGIPTTTFNPLVGSWNLQNNTGTHQIWATTEDFASILASPLMNINEKVSVNFVEPLAELDTVNPYYTHNINNFTKTDPRRTSHPSTFMESIQEKGKMHNEFVSHQIAETSVKEGESFTDYMKKISPSDVNLLDDSLSNRVKMNTIFTTSWLENGGTFTLEEQQHLTSQDPSTEKLSTTPKERKEFVNKEIKDQQNQLNQLEQEGAELVKQLDEYYEPKDHVLNETLGQRTQTKLKTAGLTVRSALIGTGSVIATEQFVKGAEEMSGVKLPEPVEEVSIGALSSAGMAALTGAAVLPEAIAGGGAYLAGSEVGKASYSLAKMAGADDTVATHSALISGGMTGGLVSGVTTALLTGGSVLAPEVVLPAMALGTVISEGFHSVESLFSPQETEE